MIGPVPGQRMVGLQLPIQTGTALLASPWEADATPSDLAAVAEVADRAGFDYLGVCDHVAIPESHAASMSTFWMDPVSTLGFLAAHTERIGLLTHVYVLPYRHPRMAAKQFATIDYLSRGRLIAGIGGGHVEAEFDMLGVDFAGRGPKLDEAVPALIRALEAEFVDGLGATPRPCQTPRPPMWIAGSSPAAVRRAAQFGDGWLPQGPATADLIDRLKAQLDRFGRSPETFVTGHIAAPVHIGDPDWDVGQRTLTGTPGQIAERLVDGVDPMVNQMQIRVVARSLAECCDQLEWFAADILPMVHQ